MLIYRATAATLYRVDLSGLSGPQAQAQPGPPPRRCRRLRARLRAALARVAEARRWVREGLAIEQAAMKPFQATLGQGLPLTRKERQGYRWP